MRCLINYARTHSGTHGVDGSKALEKAAGVKAGDVMQCGFSHTACGRPADLYARRYGYTSASSWRWGENLAWGRGKNGTAREIMRPGSLAAAPRRRCSTARSSDAGIGLRQGSFSGQHNVSVWVLEVGCHC